MSESAPTVPQVSLARIFLAFLVIGVTSVGGGVVGYLRANLVVSQKWLDDETFVELLSICQSLPGLNSSNMAILVGDRLRGGPGALVALIGICLPGGLIMAAAGAAYGSAHKASPLVPLMLHGVSAGAVGMVLYVSLQLGAKTIRLPSEFFFAAVTLFLVAYLKWSVLLALAVVGAIAIVYYRPRKPPAPEPDSR
jgi:chromate transporter